ncbi:hypothetical protein [Pseudomonas flexibilis]|uniref:hypothetical protein n=1 Tax=Pseudomonas flexibilis TaxID=706570 RepID=UPI003F58E8F0
MSSDSHPQRLSEIRAGVHTELSFQHRNRSRESCTMPAAPYIDAEAFREYLNAVGLEIPSQTSPAEACEQAVRGLDAQRARELRHLVEQLLAGSATLHPEVRQAISHTLLPALCNAAERTH